MAASESGISGPLRGAGHRPNEIGVAYDADELVVLYNRYPLDEIFLQ